MFHFNNLISPHFLTLNLISHLAIVLAVKNPHCVRLNSESGANSGTVTVERERETEEGLYTELRTTGGVLHIQTQARQMDEAT